MKSLLRTHSKHPSYKSILFKNKKQSSSPRSSNSLCCCCSTKSTQVLRWRTAAFPVIPTPGASPEGRRVGNPRSKDRNMLRSIRCGGCKVAASTVRARQIFLIPRSRDRGGEPPCSPLFPGKQKSETCLSQ